MAARVREILAEEVLPEGVVLPGLHDRPELRACAAHLLALPRSRWPADPDPLAQAARAVAVTARRLEGSESLTTAEALRLVLKVAAEGPPVYPFPADKGPVVQQRARETEPALRKVAGPQ